MMAIGGKARPKPRLKNTANSAAGGCANANPTAAPINGAVQGVATIVANTPVKKLPLYPERPANEEPIPVTEPPIENTPDKLSPTANIK